MGDTNLDFGVLYYSYSKDKGLTPGRYSYTELKAAISQTFGPVTLGGAVYYSPEYPGNGGSATYVELNAAAPIAKKLTLSGAVGNQSIDNYPEYKTWNLGLTYALTDKLSADLRYWDTSEHKLGSIYDSRVAVSLKAAF